MTTTSHSEPAAFTSRALCQSWIDDRVLRFQIKMHLVETPGGLVAVPQKGPGKVVLSASPDYKKMAYDEPLSRYAEPVRDGVVTPTPSTGITAERWLAVIRK